MTSTSNHARAAATAAAAVAAARLTRAESPDPESPRAAAAAPTASPREAREASTFERVDARRARGIDGWTGPLEPKISWEHQPHAAPRKSWWPMFNWGAPGIGNPKENHWAASGCLDKYDRVFGTDARQWQLDNRYRSYVDGLKTALHIDDTWDAFNAGHCNQEAMRAVLFEEPKYSVRRPVSGAAGAWVNQFRNFPIFGGVASWLSPVTSRFFKVDDVEFTTADIRGLMVLCMDSLVDESQGNQGVSFVGFRYSSPQPGDQPNDPRRDLEEPYPHVVIDQVCKPWGRDKNLGIIVERHAGETLDNRAYDGGAVEHLAQPPVGFNPDAVPAGGEVKFYRIAFQAHEEPEHNIELTAWVHAQKNRADDGAENTQYTSGWIHDRSGFLDRIRNSHGSDHPDFYWIPHPKPGVLEGKPWRGPSTTNPKVDTFEVWKMYQESLGKDWRTMLGE